MTAQHGLGLVRGAALRDAAEVEQHAGFGQARGASAGIQLELRVAHQRPRAGEGSAVRHLRGPARPPPEAHDGADGGVESASTPASPFLGGGQHAEEVGSDGNGRTAGAAAQRHQLAVGTVVAEDLVQIGDAREGGVGGLPRLLRAARVQHETKRRPHVGLGELMPRQGIRSRALRREQQERYNNETTPQRHRGHRERTEKGISQCDARLTPRSGDLLYLIHLSHPPLHITSVFLCALCASAAT